jgi:hypothetical protein
VVISIKFSGSGQTSLRLRATSSSLRRMSNIRGFCGVRLRCPQAGFSSTYLRRLSLLRAFRQSLRRCSLHF